MKLKRLISLLLVVVMLASLAPLSVFAEGVSQTDAQTDAQTVAQTDTQTVAEDVEQEENLRAEEATASVMATGDADSVKINGIYVAIAPTSSNDIHSGEDLLIGSSANAGDISDIGDSRNAALPTVSGDDQKASILLAKAKSTASPSNFSGTLDYTTLGAYFYCPIADVGTVTVDMQSGRSSAPYIVLAQIANEGYGQVPSGSAANTEWRIDSNVTNMRLKWKNTGSGNYLGWYRPNSAVALAQYDLGTSSSINQYQANGMSTRVWYTFGSVSNFSDRDYETKLYSTGVGTGEKVVTFSEAYFCGEKAWFDSTQKKNEKNWSTTIADYTGYRLRCYCPSTDLYSYSTDNTSGVVLFRENTDFKVDLTVDVTDSYTSQTLETDSVVQVYNSSTIAVTSTLADDLGGSFTGFSGFNGKKDFNGYTYGSSSTRTASMTVTSGTDVAYVDGTNIKFYKAGTATVQIKYQWTELDGSNTTYTLQKTFTVKNTTFSATAKVNNNTVSGAYTLTNGGSATVSAAVTINPSTASLPTGCEWTWKSSNSDAVSVSGNSISATVTGKNSVNTATITGTCTYKGQVLCSCTQTVKHNITVSLSITDVKPDANDRLIYNGKTNGEEISFATKLTDGLGDTYTAGVGSFKGYSSFPKYTYGASANRSASIAISDPNGILNYTSGSDTATFTGKHGAANVTVRYDWKDADGTSRYVSKSFTVINADYWIALSLDGGTPVKSGNFDLYSYDTGTNIEHTLKAELRSDLTSSGIVSSGGDPAYLPIGELSFVWPSGGTGVVSKTDPGNEYCNVAFDSDSMQSTGTYAETIKIRSGYYPGQVWFTVAAKIGGTTFVETIGAGVKNHPAGVAVMIDSVKTDTKAVELTGSSKTVTLTAVPMYLGGEYAGTDGTYVWNIPTGSNYSVSTSGATATITFNGKPAPASISASVYIDDYSTKQMIGSEKSVDTNTATATITTSAKYQVTIYYKDKNHTDAAAIKSEKTSTYYAYGSSQTISPINPPSNSQWALDDDNSKKVNIDSANPSVTFYYDKLVNGTGYVYFMDTNGYYGAADTTASAALTAMLTNQREKDTFNANTIFAGKTLVPSADRAGFSADSTKTGDVSAITVEQTGFDVKLYYSRNKYQVTINYYDKNTDSPIKNSSGGNYTTTTADSYYYGANPSIAIPTEPSGYYIDEAEKAKLVNITTSPFVTFYYDKKVSVKVEHYLQNEKRDGYPNTPIATDTDNAWHAYTLYTAEYKSYEGFTADTSKSNKATPDNNGAEIKLYYTRNTYTTEIRKDGTAITSDYILNSFAGSNTIDVQAVQTGSTPTGKQLSDIPGGHWEWTSSNTSVATVEVGSSDSSKATVTGKTGDNTNAKATITATYKGDNGVFATCSFVVDNTGKATFTSKIMKGTSNVTNTTQILKSFTGSKTLAVQAMQDGDSVPPGKSLSDYTGGEWVWTSSDPTIATVAVDSSDSSKATVTGQTGSSSNNKNEEVTITAKYMVGDKEITICSFKVNNIGYVTFTPTLKYNDTVIKNGVPIGDDANIDKKTLNSYKGGSNKTATLIVTATADVEGCSLADYTDGYWTWADDSTRIDTAMRTDDGKDKTQSTAQVTGTVKNGTPTVTATFKCGSQTIVTAKVKIQNVGSKLDIQINKDAAKNCNYPDTKEIRGVNDGETLDVKVVLWQDGNVVDIDPNKIVPVSETDSTPKFTATSSKVNCFDFSRNGATGTITFKGIATKEISIKCYYNDSGIQSSDLSATATVTAYQGISSAKTYIVDYGLPLVDSEITGKIVGMTLDNIGDDVTLVTEKYPTFDKCTPGTSIEIPGWGTLAVTKPATNSGGTGEVTFTPSGFAAAATTIYYAADCSNELSDGYKYSKITIKPAATVYYEDTAVEDGGAITYAGGVDGWTTDTTSNPKATDALADTIYGCDSRYANETGYSMNSAHKVTVNASRNDATATFDFRGTGFDIISRTGGDCGMVRVSVTNKTTNKTTKYVVDTYRGFELKNDSAKPYIEYTWKFMSDGTWHVQHVAGSENRADNGVYVDTVRDGYDIDKQTAPPTDAKEGEIFYTYTKNYKWVATTNGSALYQVPIMKITGLPLGDYTVTVSPIYSSALDRTDPKRNCFVFYLDAVRIYTGSTSTKSAEGSYAWFFNLRQELKTNVGAASISGAAIIDGLNTATTENYQDYGSNNEIYLKPDSSLTFKLTANTEPKMVLLGLKTYADDKTKSSDALKAKVEVSYKIGDEKQSTTDEITVGSAADMYYQLSNYPYNEAGTTITITNTGSTTAVLTTLKVTFSSKSGNSDVNPANSLEATTLSANSASILADEPEQDDGSDITCEITVDEQVLQDAVECIKAVMFGEIGPEVPFVPNLEVLAPEKVTVGEDITLEVTTSDDVAYITVNGVKIETNDNFVWSYTVKAEEVGEMSFEVKAYNADDKVAENNVTVAVTVEKMPFEPLINVMAPAAVTVGETITIQVATSDDVAYITVNDERVDTKDGTVWTYTTTAEAEGELSFVVVAYSEDGVAAEDEKTATVTVSQYVKSTWEIIVDAIMRYFKKLIGGN